MANDKQRSAAVGMKVTAEGLKKLEEELKYLKSVRRQEIAEELEIARSFGDLSENSEYDEAKNAQAQMEARIAELEAKLQHVIVIDESELTTDIVKIGVTVRILDIELGEEAEYRIIGSTEANPLAGSISDESPVGIALVDHRINDIVDVETPSGVVKYQILEISKGK